MAKPKIFCLLENDSVNSVVIVIWSNTIEGNFITFTCMTLGLKFFLVGRNMRKIAFPKVGFLKNTCTLKLLFCIICKICKA